jgi:glutathione synthase/RimK-type ligase-like ATP-grasp enzyme
MSRNRKIIGIITFQNDIHALSIAKEIEKYDNILCHIIEVDKICDSGGLSWSAEDDRDFQSTIKNNHDELVNIKDIDLVWWRRVNSPQKVSSDITNPIHVDLINNDCKEAVIGLFLTKFKGIWINDPIATKTAENKIYQLNVAKKFGFQIPQTIVSQNPDYIKKFCEKLNNNVIVKPVRGTKLSNLFTRMLTKEHITSTSSMRICPVMYQEYIRGSMHIRAHVLGNNIYSVLIKSEGLDWRENLDIPFKVIDLPNSIQKRLHKVVRSLGLKMGIVDLKMTQNNNFIWLEINPQGQFLFVQGISGLNLISHFARFLYEGLKSDRSLPMECH